MISQSQIELLSALVDGSDQRVGVAALADRLDWSLSHTSRVVSSLESMEAIRVQETGGQKLVELADTKPIEQLETLLSEYNHVPFAEHLYGSALQLLYYLDKPRTGTELAEESSISRATVYRRLGDLQEIGIVGKSKSRFQINDPFAPLVSIAWGLAHRQHRREAEQHTSGVNIIWERHDEYLLACDTPIDAPDIHLTGPGLLAEFDLQLLTRERHHYFRSERVSSVSPADLVCHLLLIDDGPRYRSYCLLLIEAMEVKPTTLQDRAEYYEPLAEVDLVEITEELIEYLNNRGAGDQPQLPSWDEFQRLAADYEVET